ncbi:VanZ family protein [Methylomonas methanica]|uniref:VanZ family protein n=1 Tax=Methylomonas methanica (strain DSM 25384 / MC09) TaxID=857087 RepID=G0A017_METMM|nr:VanZ family protein [Methylomonas methanica]AEG01156.1 VanZ family protein [Methylomonas methanica MC09]
MLIKKIFDWSALLAYCGWVFWLSSQETLPMPPLFEFQDKLMHFGAYFLMAAFSWRALRHQGHTGNKLALAVWLFCCVYGLSDEWHQSFVPGRTSSGWDWLADSLGAAAAAWLLLTLKQRQQHCKSA